VVIYLTTVALLVNLTVPAHAFHKDHDTSTRFLSDTSDGSTTYGNTFFSTICISTLFKNHSNKNSYIIKFDFDPWSITTKTPVYQLFVWDYPCEAVAERETNLDLLEQEIVSGRGISWAICKSAPRPRQIITPASTPPCSFLQARYPFCHPTNSVKHRRQWYKKRTIITRKLCYHKDYHTIHNPTIRTWFAARKSISTTKYRSLGCTGKNKAKMAISVAVEAKPEVEIWWWPKKSTFWPLFPIHSFRPFLAKKYRFKDIATFVSQLPACHFFPPYPSLPKISPCSPGSRWMIFGLRRAKMLGSTYMVMIHQRHRQTDGHITCDSNTVLCTVVHRAVKITNMKMNVYKKFNNKSQTNDKLWR